MKTASLIARLLLGLIFLTFGLNGFFHFIPLPPPAGLAGQFFTALFVSRFYTVIFAVQTVGGILLLANRYVPLALVALAAVIFNILAFHALMAPEGLPLALFTAALWVVVALRHRAYLAPLFTAKTEAVKEVAVPVQKANYARN